mmetsp:Transcript_3267/g.8065  ORF Transcript_3267/g.8065 Transcript_3267/m.8065 type:complete len:318 (-) Transcript_3267:62-1015(-)
MPQLVQNRLAFAEQDFRELQVLVVVVLIGPGALPDVPRKLPVAGDVGHSEHLEGLPVEDQVVNDRQLDVLAQRHDHVVVVGVHVIENQGAARGNRIEVLALLGLDGLLARGVVVDLLAVHVDLLDPDLGIDLAHVLRVDPLLDVLHHVRDEVAPGPDIVRLGLVRARVPLARHVPGRDLQGELVRAQQAVDGVTDLREDGSALGELLDDGEVVVRPLEFALVPQLTERPQRGESVVAGEAPVPRREEHPGEAEVESPPGHARDVEEEEEVRIAPLLDQVPSEVWDPLGQCNALAHVHDFLANRRARDPRARDQGHGD